MSDAFLNVNRAIISENALQYRVPVVSGASQTGSLVSYAPDMEDIFRRSASYVDKILRGALPSSFVSGVAFWPAADKPVATPEIRV
jgi:putative tryptophan/tyrosine transport system substrate-binding protein